MDAESLLRRALEIRAEADGKDSSEYATALNNLAVSLKSQVHVTLPFLVSIGLLFVHTQYSSFSPF